MIKKYHQFIKENKSCTREDIEDQFLRLEEVFGAGVSIDYEDIRDIHQQFFLSEEAKKFLKGARSPCVKMLITKLEPTKDVYDELERIKYRMELMYPVKVFYEMKNFQEDIKIKFFNVFIKFTNYLPQ